MPDDPSPFEIDFQAFVERGGLDEDPRHVVSEEYDRTRESMLCVHRKVVRECVMCYKAPKPYFPGDTR